MFPCGARPSHWPGDSPRPPAPTGQTCEALTCSILQLSLTWRDLWELQPLVASSCALCWPRACRAEGGTVRHTQQALGCSSLGTLVGTSVCVSCPEHCVHLCPCTRGSLGALSPTQCPPTAFPSQWTLTTMCTCTCVSRAQAQA